MKPLINTFYNSEYLVKDLIRRYYELGTVIVAVDFDDTIFNYRKDPTKDFKPVHDLLIRAKQLGFKLVIYTARNSSRWDEVIHFCNSINLEIDGLNEDVVELIEPTSGKIYYNILLDDKAGLWEACNVLSKVVSHIEYEKTK